MNRPATITALTEPGFLSTFSGPVSQIHIEPLTGIGFSASELQRVIAVLKNDNTKTFVLKKIDREGDWLSQRSHDGVGREAALLEEPLLEGIWNYLYCPYLAFAREGKLTGLLMEDLSAHLFPDVREPIDVKSEDIILDKITLVHATFWQSEAIKKFSWLTGPCDYFNLLRPGVHEQDRHCPPPDKIRDHIIEGWKLALPLLSDKVKNYLTGPVEEMIAPWKELPVTLLHGDLKIANMAILPGDRLSLFDWPLVGCAPCGIELGWYLAVNATRLARTKKDLINKYRSLLESHLSFIIDEKLWQRIEHLAIVTGAIMMLWNKALGSRSGTQKGKEEWDWWSGRLEEVVGKM